MKVINKQEKQLKKIKGNEKKKTNMKIKQEEKSGEVVLLTDNLNNILMTFDLNFVDSG